MKKTHAGNIRQHNESVWLDKSLPIEDALALCNPYPDDLMTRHEVHIGY